VKLIVFFYLLTVVYCAYSQQANINPPAFYDQLNAYNNALYCTNGGTATISGVITDRIPRFPAATYSPNVPAACTDPVKKIIENKIWDWKNQDFKQIQSLANRFCSFNTGWIEKVPNTCTAGGPPPICPADHWQFVGTDNSRRVFESENAKIRNERYEELRRLQKAIDDQICNCWVQSVAEKKKEVFTKVVVDHPAEQGQKVSLTNMKMPCMSGCPTGYECVHGFCEKTITMTDRGWENSQAVMKEKLGVTGLTSGIELSLGKLSEMATWSKKIFSVWEAVDQNFYFKVATGSLETTEAGNFNSAFMNKVRDVNDGVNRLEMLYDELRRSYANQSLAREASAIKNDIAQERSKLSKNLYLLNEYKEGGQIEKQFGFCEGMLDFYTKSIWDYCNVVLNVPVN
jgi:hypothetical protein